MKFLGRLKLWQKLAVLVTAMAAPIALLGFFYLSEANRTVSMARNELDGARYLQALGAVLAGTAGHRGRAHALLNGDQARQGDVAASQAEIDKLMADMDAVDAELGARFKTSEQWRQVHADWNDLRTRVTKLTPDESLAAHNALIERIRALMTTVSMNSQLSLDPDAATSSLTSVAGNVPEAVIDADLMRMHATTAAVKGYLGADDRMAIQLYGERALAALTLSDTQLRWADEEAQAHVRPALETARREFERFRAAVRTNVLDAQTLAVTSGQVFEAGIGADESLMALSGISYTAMRGAVERRLSAELTERNITMAIVALVLGFALSLAWLITRALSKPMSQVISVFQAIAAGRYDNAIAHSGQDEVGQVLRALDEMQGKLRRQIEAERTQAAENARIRQALDKVSTNVLLADASHRIIYLNETAAASFARAQGEIRKALPGFDAERLQGASLDSLSTDPAQQRRLLDSLSGTDVQERTLGACTFRVVSNPVLSREGERIGTVMEWTERTQELAVEKEMQSMLSAVIAGDLEQRIALEGKAGFFEAMSRGVNQLVDNMAEIVRKVKMAAGEVYRGAEEISQGNANLSQRTEEQSSSLEETASSMEEMTSTVKQNADNAGQANQLAIAARDQAEKGGAVVAKAVRAMADINDASKKIADIIGVIDEIAFQTNLLALNAAVEAARAGEQGRGFAVVASEVRNLAGRSATAAKEIKDLIQDSVRKVEDGSALVTQSGQTLEQIVASVKKVSDIVAEIAAASREQSSGIEQVNRAVMQMDELTQQNAALVEEATAASQAMAQQARELNEMIGRYRVSLQSLTGGGLAHGGSTGADTRAESAEASASGPPRIERRGPNRPWSNRTRQAATPPAALRKAVGANEDTEWQEF